MRKREACKPLVLTPRESQIPSRCGPPSQHTRLDPPVAGVGQPPSRRFLEECLLKNLGDKLVMREPGYCKAGELPVVQSRVFDTKKQ